MVRPPWISRANRKFQQQSGANESMKPVHLLAAAAAVFASAACNGEQGRDGAANQAPIEAIAPPEGGDWTQMVSQTAEGGFLMGNPNADVKVVEFASMTCPHCAEFAETGFDPLVNEYVKTGRVAFELRNFVRDPLDITMSLLARCGGAERFFPLTDAMFANQAQFFERVQSASTDQQQALTQQPPAQQFQGFASLAGLQQWSAQRGIPSARQQQCLTNQAEIDRLVQMSTDAVSQHNIPGTPAFLINGQLAENASDWGTLEPKIREALQ
jgi:protein-disulfide isomerase